MRRKLVGILIIGLLLTTVFPSIGASINKNDEKEDTTIYESRIFGIGFVRINGFTHTIKGYIIYAINDGQAISMEFINIKYIDVDNVFVGYFTPLIFFIRYNPA